MFAPRAIGVAGVVRQRAAARKARDIRELTEDLHALAASYTHLSPDRLQAFSRSAATRPAAATLRRVEVVTTLEGHAVRIVAEFRTLADGPTHQAPTTLRYPHDDLVITIEQFDYQRAAPAR